jgi:hypothetical protein
LWGSDAKTRPLLSRTVTLLVAISANSTSRRLLIKRIMVRLLPESHRSNSAGGYSHTLPNIP